MPDSDGILESVAQPPGKGATKGIEMTAPIEDASTQTWYRLLIRALAVENEMKVTQPSTFVDKITAEGVVILLRYSKSHVLVGGERVVGEVHEKIAGPGKFQVAQEWVTGVADPDRKIRLDRQFKGREAKLGSGKGIYAIKVIAPKEPKVAEAPAKEEVAAE